MIYRLFIYFIVVMALAGCQGTPTESQSVDATKVTLVQVSTPTSPSVESVAETQTVLTPEPVNQIAPTVEVLPPVVSDLRPIPDDWRDWPVVPVISDRTLEIFRSGLEKGRLPGSFSKVGDCETSTEWFLADFDKGSSHYNLGDFQELSNVIDFYSGSFERLGVAAQRGFTAASVLNPYWRNADLCEKTETPLACEIRLHNPSLAIIMVGTNDAIKPATFEKNMRAVIEAAIDAGVVPLLTTKADNLEGDHQINYTVAKLAYEYDIPLWNYWRAIQDLPDQGLQEDGAHLTWGPNDFSDPENLMKAWPVRNLTALQVLKSFHERIIGIKEE